MYKFFFELSFLINELTIPAMRNNFPSIYRIAIWPLYNKFSNDANLLTCVSFCDDIIKI